MIRGSYEILRNIGPMEAAILNNRTTPGDQESRLKIHPLLRNIGPMEAAFLNNRTTPGDQESRLKITLYTTFDDDDDDVRF